MYAMISRNCVTYTGDATTIDATIAWSVPTPSLSQAGVGRIRIRSDKTAITRVTNITPIVNGNVGVLISIARPNSAPPAARCFHELVENGLTSNTAAPAPAHKALAMSGRNSYTAFWQIGTVSTNRNRMIRCHSGSP